MAAKPPSVGVGTRIIVVVAVVAVGLAAYIYAFRPEAQTVAASKGIAYNAVTGSVTVEAEFPQPLTSEVDGRLETSELTEGRLVKAGEVIARLNTEGMTLDLDQLRSDYEVAKKRLAIGKEQTAIDRDNAKDALDKAEFDYKAGRMADVDIAKARRTFRALENKLALDAVNNEQLISSLQNAIKVKENLLAKMSFSARYDGVVSVVYLRPGDLVPAKTPIGTLISTTRTVVAKISEENFVGVALNQKATVHFNGVENNHDATVIKILPTADPETQRYVVHLDVKIAPEQLIPGRSGEVSIILGEHTDAIKVPRRALSFSKKWVYVVADGRIRKREVDVGFVGLNDAEITRGLSVGEEVVVEDVTRFQEGDRVRIKGKK